MGTCAFVDRKLVEVSVRGVSVLPFFCVEKLFLLSPEANQKVFQQGYI